MNRLLIVEDQPIPSRDSEPPGGKGKTRNSEEEGTGHLPNIRSVFYNGATIKSTVRLLINSQFFHKIINDHSVAKQSRTFHLKVTLMRAEAEPSDDEKCAFNL